MGAPIWERSVLAGAIGNFAVMAPTYMHESGVTEAHAAQAAVKARRNACLTESAHLQMPDITVEDVLKSEMLAYPVKRLDMCPQIGWGCGRHLR